MSNETIPEPIIQTMKQLVGLLEKAIKSESINPGDKWHLKDTANCLCRDWEERDYRSLDKEMEIMLMLRVTMEQGIEERMFQTDNRTNTHTKDKWFRIAAWAKELAEQFPSDEEIDAARAKRYGNNYEATASANSKVSILLDYMKTLGKDYERIAKRLIGQP